MAGSLYFLSESARAGLIRQATSKMHIKKDTSQRYHGLSNYIRWVTEYGYLTDARPAEVKESDASRLEVGLFPYWSTEEVRQPVRLTLHPLVKTKLISIANQFLIINNNRGLSSLRKDMPSSRISAVLEAIGIEWLLVREK